MEGFEQLRGPAAPAPLPHFHASGIGAERKPRHTPDALTGDPADSAHDGAAATHAPRPVSFATGLPWHVASRNRDRQLIRAAKKAHLSNNVGRSRDGAHDVAFPSAADDEDEGPAGFLHHLGVMKVNDEVSVEEALLKGADVNAADFSGNTALHYACEEGYQELAEFLLARDDVSVDAAATMDWTPLHCAASKGRVAMMRSLTDRGCNVHLAARDGNTALHMAAMGGHLEAVKLLVELGCDTRLKNEEGQTAADLALMFRNGEHVQIVKHLREFRTTTHVVKRQAHDSFALQIRLIEGHDIASMDVKSYSDPYCALCISNPPGFVRSFTCRNTDKPRWDQILLLRLNLAPQHLRIEIWDDDFGATEDDFIGEGSVNLSYIVSSTRDHLSRGQRYDPDHPDYPMSAVKIPVRAKKVVQGYISMELKILKIPTHPESAKS